MLGCIYSLRWVSNNLVTWEEVCTSIERAMSATYLSYWLLFAAALRSLAVVIGVFFPDVLKTKVFRSRPDYVNPLYGRTFAAWTFVTCMLCVLCAFNMQEPTLYLATLGSFSVALLHLGSEFVVFRTSDLKGSLSPLIVATVSIVWMVYGWGRYVSY